MTDQLSRLATALNAADPTTLAITSGLLLVFVLLHVLHLRFRDKGAVALLSVGKWLVLCWALSEAEHGVLRGRWSLGVNVFFGLCLWLSARAALHDLYAGVYMARIKRQPVNSILVNLMSFLAAVLVVLFELGTVFKVNLSSLLTSSAILTAVVGLSMQDTIGSLMSGLLLQSEKPFTIGDWIKVGDHEGRVSAITWRYTKLTTLNDTQVLIPNNAIAKERMVNYSRPVPQVTLGVPVPVPLSVPPVRARAALEDALKNARFVSRARDTSVRLAEIGRDEAVYRLFFSVEDYNDSAAAKSEILTAVWYEFVRLGIDFPVTRRLVTRQPLSGALGPELTGMLGSIGLFAGMEQQELELLVRCSALRTFAPGQAIVRRGQAGATMFVLVSGHVAVSLEDQELSRLGPGDVFGEMALLTGEARQADVSALEPATCLEVDREAFRIVLTKNPGLEANVRQIFADRERQNREMLRSEETEDTAQGLFDRFREIFW